MTAETLKPFITPTSENCPTTVPATRLSLRERNSGSRNLLIVTLCTIALVLSVGLLGVTIWNSMRVCNLETEVKSLNRVIESMQKRLGLNYLDDLQDFEKEYQNALIDNPNTLDDIDDPDDDDDDDMEDDDDVIIPNNTDEDDDSDDDDYTDLDTYDELIKKFSSYDDSEEDNEENNSNLSDNDNLYDDFEKFKDSKKKNGVRKSRSIAHVPKAQQQETITNQINKTENSAELKEQTSTSAPTLIHYRNHKSTSRPHALHLVEKQPNNFVAQRMEERVSPLRQRNHRRRQKFPMIKSGESLLSAKSTSSLMSSLPSRPAAHFHLNRRIPDRHSTTKIDSYTGDMYIGHPSWPNELDTENYFQLNNGVLIVREPGLYYVYAQVCYNNTHDQNGFVIFHGHKPFLQCLNTVPTNMPLKIHTCHTSGLLYLQANEAIHLRDFHTDRNVILKETNNRSYFGLIKI